MAIQTDEICKGCDQRLLPGGKDAKVVAMLDNEGLKLPKAIKPLAAKKGSK